MIFTLALVSAKSNERLRNLLDVVGGLILSLDNPLDCHDKILLSLELTILKYLCTDWNTNQSCVTLSSKWLLPRK